MIQMNQLKNILFLVLSIGFMCKSNAQESKRNAEDKNVMTVAFAASYIPAGTQQDNINKGHLVPGIGIDYFRKINERFDLGTMMDIELATYVIPRKEDLIRDKAFVVTIIGSFMINDNWGVFLGPGYELEKHKSFPIFRVGKEYLIRFNSVWFIPVGFFYDAKDGYDTYSLSVGAGINF